MKEGSQEFYDMREAFERSFSRGWPGCRNGRLDHEPRGTKRWYQDGEVNAYFVAFMHGYSLGRCVYLQYWQLAKEAADEADAQVLELSSRVEFLEKALDQISGAYGVSLPDTPVQNQYGDDETDEEFAERLREHLPFGDHTVLFAGSDECWFPTACPELAQYLRARYAAKEGQA